MRQIVVLLMLISLACFSGSDAAAQPARPMIELKTGDYRIEAEYAETLELRKQGLMDRHILPANQGVLFIFPVPQRHCLWMRGTHLPLSVAFLAVDGTIINIAEMSPETEDSYCAVKPAFYALEMNGGWFAKREIVPGDRISGIEKAPRGR